MQDGLTHIGSATRMVLEKAIARRDARLRELERVLMTDPYLPARREAAAEYPRLKGE